MSKSIMLVELYELEAEAEKKGYHFGYVSKGHEFSRESLNYGDARKFVKYDAVIILSSQRTAEELRIMMEQVKEEKEPLICWCGWSDFWRNHGGHYQITTVSKSFLDVDVMSAKQPNFEAFEALCTKLESLNDEKPKHMSK